MLSSLRPRALPVDAFNHIFGIEVTKWDTFRVGNPVPDDQSVALAKCNTLRVTVVDSNAVGDTDAHNDLLWDAERVCKPGGNAHPGGYAVCFGNDDSQ